MAIVGVRVGVVVVVIVVVVVVVVAAATVDAAVVIVSLYILIKKIRCKRLNNKYVQRLKVQVVQQIEEKKITRTLMHIG